MNKFKHSFHMNDSTTLLDKSLKFPVRLSGQNIFAVHIRKLICLSIMSFFLLTSYNYNLDPENHQNEMHQYMFVHRVLIFLKGDNRYIWEGIFQDILFEMSLIAAKLRELLLLTDRCTLMKI